MENPTTTTVSTSSVGMRYGLITGVLSIIISLILFMTNLDQSPAKWITTLILGGGIWMAHGYFKQNNGGFMSFGQGLGIGTVVSAVVGVLSGIFGYVYVTYIDATYMDRVMEKARADMEAKGTMSGEQIDQAMAMSQKFMGGPMMIVWGIVGTIIFGFIISLIVSAFTKNNRPEFE